MQLDHQCRNQAIEVRVFLLKEHFLKLNQFIEFTNSDSRATKQNVNSFNQFGGKAVLN